MLRTDEGGREEKAQEGRDGAEGKQRRFSIQKRGMTDKRGRVTIRVRHPSQRRKIT